MKKRTTVLLKHCRPFRTEAPGAAVEYGPCEPSRDGKKLFTDKCGEDFEDKETVQAGPASLIMIKKWM